MAKKLNLKAVMMSDLKNSGYRFGQHKALEGVKKAIIMGLEKDESVREHTAAFAKVLDTPTGTALLSYLIGIGLTYAPRVSENEHVESFAKEFRVDGLHKVGHELIDQVKGNILPVLNNIKTMMPKEAKPKIRVQTPENSEVEVEENNVRPFRKSQAK